MSDMVKILIGELLGTFALVLLGNGVVASVKFKNMFAANTRPNWVLITLAWGFAVFVGVIIANAFSTGAHLNPAVTVFATIKGLKGTNAAGTVILKGVVYIVAQFIGAALAQVTLNFLNWQHIKENDAELLKGSSCTGPSHRKAFAQNFGYEFIGTLVLLAFILASGFGSNKMMIENNNFGLDVLGPVPVTFVVMAIGMSLGSVTGYAINPARDLAPRLVYFATTKLFKKQIKNPVSPDFAYGLSVPVAAPLFAGVVMGLVSFAV
ncbi:aquaporin family protein [Mycoplasmopsis pullorum]|uniref:MIP/aquaporin family protein n=1 Tax=Mycoplasmopsis pullorum TaxID=48003 RepID=UPI0011181279|nr:MIP/aquaporin family protein [Mycoplasmopsis pullorum]TNK83560.1 aquaporin family protein [Mycoplasmopsis pullorum]TNK92111.1 aquaporin family protein [Mycoplasmopsis pullorum]